MQEIETKKKLVLGDDPRARTDVTEETKNPHSLEAKHAQELMARAGEMFKADGAKYLGSATVHYYEKPTLHGTDIMFACQCNVEKVAENIADLGWKSLRGALMKAVGRKEPKTRN
jgi:redox-regulated HSP33 family molecular chaperone